MRPDLSFMVGWETGRQSEPAFMDMNLHATRGASSPHVVLYQYDLADPMNPLGLLVAYAESQVLPVVSDFDTFLVGSMGMEYSPLPDAQKAPRTRSFSQVLIDVRIFRHLFMCFLIVCCLFYFTFHWISVVFRVEDLMAWCLDHTADIIGMPQKRAWTARWLEVLKDEAGAKGAGLKATPSRL